MTSLGKTSIDNSLSELKDEKIVFSKYGDKKYLTGISVGRPVYYLDLFWKEVYSILFRREKLSP